MQNVRILVDGREVYNGEIAENAKIDIQKTDRFTKAHPKTISLEELCEAWSRGNNDHPLCRGYLLVWSDDGYTLKSETPNASKTIEELGL